MIWPSLFNRYFPAGWGEVKATISTRKLIILTSKPMLKFKLTTRFLPIYSGLEITAFPDVRDTQKW